MSAAADAPLRARHVLVQGATGAVGAEIVRALGAQGAHVSVAVRRPWQVARVETRLTEAGVARQDQLVAVVDSEDAEAAAGLVKGGEDALGPIVAFVSAAGAFAMAPLGEEPSGQAGDLWRANFASVHTLARAVVIPMRRRRAGALVFTGAAAAIGEPPAGMTLYVASKAALHAYAASLRAELLPVGVRVAVVAPRIIDTPANRAAMPGADRAGWVAPAVVAAHLLALAAHGGDALIVLP
jgi:NAD(P)-dependent dehydrogenase (short-subunit alcohol dehydrogenase family)